ncbi:MAG: hypothetical protein ABWK53_00535 [Anaerolineales bacterium]
MFRRRPFVRPFRRAVMPNIPPALRRANELLASGNYPAAAEAYEQLARGAQTRGLPHDAQLFLQAGRCRLLAGQVQAGMVNLKQGLAVIAGRGNWPRLLNAARRAVADLNARGLTAEAAEIETWLQQTLPEGFAAAPAAAPGRSRVLPTRCPACGAPLHADEAEWSDEFTAECPYCGAAVRAESSV